MKCLRLVREWKENADRDSVKVFGEGEHRAVWSLTDAVFSGCDLKYSN